MKTGYQRKLGLAELVFENSLYVISMPDQSSELKFKKHKLEFLLFCRLLAL